MTNPVRVDGVVQSAHRRHLAVVVLVNPRVDGRPVQKAVKHRVAGVVHDKLQRNRGQRVEQRHVAGRRRHVATVHAEKGSVRTVRRAAIGSHIEAAKQKAKEDEQKRRGLQLVDSDVKVVPPVEHEAALAGRRQRRGREGARAQQDGQDCMGAGKTNQNVADKKTKYWG